MNEKETKTEAECDTLIFYGIYLGIKYLAICIGCMLLGICWLFSLAIQLSILGAVTFGSYYVIDLTLKTSQLMHNSDPINAWPTDYDNCGNGDSYSTTDGSQYSIKHNYDVIFMSTIISVATVLLMILTNFLVSLKKCCFFEYLNIISFNIHIFYQLLFYFWMVARYSSIGMNVNNGTKVCTKYLQQGNEFKLGEIMNGDALNYYWNIVCIGWLLFNILISFIGLPMKYSYNLISLCDKNNELKWCKLEENTTEENTNNCNLKYKFKIYNIKYIGLLWMIEKLTIIIKECLSNYSTNNPINLSIHTKYKIKKTFQVASYVVWSIIKLVLILITYVGIFYVCYMTSRIQSIINHNSTESWYTFGELNSKKLYNQNKKNALLDSYDAKNAFFSIYVMTVISLSLNFGIIISNIGAVASSKNTNKISKSTLDIINTVCYSINLFSYCVNFAFTLLIYVWAIAYMSDRHMAGENGFYYKDKKTSVDAKTQNQLKLYWNVVCIGWLFYNLITTIIGIPYRDNISFIRYTLNANYNVYFSDNQIFNWCRLVEPSAPPAKTKKRKYDRRNLNESTTILITDHLEYTTSIDTDSTSGNENCVMCLKKNNQLFPICNNISCGHKVYCESCLDKFKNKVERNEIKNACPLCRCQPSNRDQIYDL
jgi:hypothetical protein